MAPPNKPPQSGAHADRASERPKASPGKRPWQLERPGGGFTGARQEGRVCGQVKGKSGDPLRMASQLGTRKKAEREVASRKSCIPRSKGAWMPIPQQVSPIGIDGELPARPNSLRTRRGVTTGKQPLCYGSGEMAQTGCQCVSPRHLGPNRDILGLRMAAEDRP